MVGLCSAIEYIESSKLACRLSLLEVLLLVLLHKSLLDRLAKTFIVHIFLIRLEFSVHPVHGLQVYAGGG